MTFPNNNPEPLLGRGDFYVQNECCTACGVPQAIAPDLVGWTNEKYRQCYWIKQPETPGEIERAVEILHAQELGCHRYSGTDPLLLAKLPVEDCDHLRPDLRLNTASSGFASGPAPNFKLFASAQPNVLTRLWRKILQAR